MGKSKKHIVWYGMKLTPEEKKQIQDLADIRGISQKEAVMNAVRDGLVAYKTSPKSGSLHQKMEHLIGKAEGPEDLTSNDEYMEDFGR